MRRCSLFSMRSDMKNDDIYANRMNPIIPGKFAGLVWLVMLVASLIRNVVPVVTGFYGADSASEITLAVIDAVLFDGVVLGLQLPLMIAASR